MAGNSGSKVKVLHICDILREYSDEEHPLTAAALAAELSKHGLSAERKAIYSDVDLLIDYGYDIIKNPPPYKGYYLGERDFQLAEARLLVDAVESAQFITESKTAELVEKIERSLSVYQRESLRLQQVYIDHRNKNTNETIYYVIDALLSAIQAGKKVRLHYLKRSIEAGERPKNEDHIYVVSPDALIWVPDRYYLVCNNAKYNNLMHLRIDRISKVAQLDETSRPLSEVSKYKGSFDAADYLSTKFNMFSGDPVRVKIKCKNDVWQIVADRFGDNVLITERTDDTFTISASATISGLDAWIMQWGDSMEVVEPKELRDIVINKAKDMLKAYGEG
jgi:predicted DNA-binding transcriptional regulator YafY